MVIFLPMIKTSMEANNIIDSTFNKPTADIKDLIPIINVLIPKTQLLEHI